MFDPSGIQHVYITCGYTDMRRGIDGLVSIVQNSFRLDPFANALFLFCGRRADRFKALYWDSDGFLLLYKRLERGRYQWPRSREEVLNLSPPTQGPQACGKHRLFVVARSSKTH